MELEFIRWLSEQLPPHPNLKLGPGDDAAILRMAQGDGCVITVDLLTDQVDFDLARVDPARVGRKALAVNLSDLAAMAARPLAAVVALALPRQQALPLAKQLYQGLLPLAEQFNVAIAGGDTNCWDGPLVISVTVVGEVVNGKPLLRSGAGDGDKILVTGKFGGSILGHHFDFQPRVEEALWLASHYPLRAGIDSSDGLSLDLWRLAEASGCGAELHAAKIPLADAARELATQDNDGRTALDHALSDGEDFELILAVPPEAASQLVARQELACGLSEIGRLVSQPGLWLVDESGVRRPLAPQGFTH
jgi:thiamine-monophosphate kinase